MAFHETLWAVTGTAAPVIALAAIVSVSDIRQALIQLTDNNFAFMYGGIHPLQQTLGYGTFSRAAFTVRSRRPLDRMNRAQQLNIPVQAAALAISLFSIAYHRNLVPPAVGVALVVGGLVVLALIGILVASERYIADLIRQGIQRIESQPV